MGYTYLKPTVGSIVKVNSHNRKCVGTIEWICVDGKDKFVQIRCADNKVIVTELENCALHRVRISKDYFDVHGNKVEGAEIFC